MPSEAVTERDSQQRRYRLFIAIECLLLFASWRLSWSRGLVDLYGILGVWHVVAIPICILYMIGKPVVMTLSPLIPTAKTRAFRRELRKRPVLDGEQFYSQFYEGSEIPRDIPSRVRGCLKHVDTLIGRIIPSDNMCYLDEELDYGDMLWIVEREFGIHFTDRDYERIDGTLDNLIRLVQSKLGPADRS